MEKRYQVFVSSTYKDLQEERKQVIQALLELDCIPSGMELFQASDDDQWTLIKRVIDDCDYYLVIIAGRYGSMRDGVGYTEMEYDYASSKNIPIIAFLHSEPDSIRVEFTDKNSGAAKKLVAFREKAQKKSYSLWKTPEELGGKVSRSVIRLIRDRPAEGWVKSRFAGDPQEMLRLRTRIEELEKNLILATSQPPQAVEELSQGDDVFTFGISNGTTHAEAKMQLSWNDLFKILGPHMLDAISETFMERKLNELLRKIAINIDSYMRQELVIDHTDFQTIKIQLRSLGLIRNCERDQSAIGLLTHWILTPFGDSYLTRLLAVKKKTNGQ